MSDKEKFYAMALAGMGEFQALCLVGGSYGGLYRYNGEENGNYYNVPYRDYRVYVWGLRFKGCGVRD